jgi:uncharacterized protein (DUF849 family)
MAKTVITCAVTGSMTTRAQHPGLPVTPGEIADACLGAAEAGAAVVHIHVRDPATGAPSMALDLYRDTVERIRARDPQLILNVTTGPGARFQPSEDDPRIAGPRTTLTLPENRVRHIEALRPDIATLDLGTLTFGREIMINTPDHVRRMATAIRSAGVTPEIELFDSGDVALCRDLVADGSLAPAPLCSIVMGVKYGFQPAPETVLYARGLLPAGARWTAFGIGRMAFPAVAMSYLAGGHVRVGLEDAVYIDAGALAPSNQAMVEKARRMVEDLGGQIANPREARELFGLPTRLAAVRPADGARS